MRQDTLADEVAFGNLAGGGIITESTSCVRLPSSGVPSTTSSTECTKTIHLSWNLPNWFRRGGLGSKARSQNVLLPQAGEFFPYYIARPAENKFPLAPKLLKENLFLVSQNLAKMYREFSLCTATAIPGRTEEPWLRNSGLLLSSLLAGDAVLISRMRRTIFDPTLIASNFPHLTDHRVMLRK